MSDEEGEETVICIGDVHGQLEKLQSLYNNLHAKLHEQFETATVIFLGDIVDRGPQVKLTLDWIINLNHLYPQQKVICLAGNHDFAMAAFLDCLPNSEQCGGDFSHTWKQLNPSEIRKGEESTWYVGSSPSDYEKMHIQGRRWGGIYQRYHRAESNSSNLSDDNKGGEDKTPQLRDSIYYARSTFESYGAEFPNREDLCSKVPISHLEFLRNLPWVYETCIRGEGLRIIAVHGGLRNDQPARQQIEQLKNRNSCISRVSQISDRGVIFDIPRDLEEEGNVVLVSGHFFTVKITQKRIILDSCGGFDAHPLSAIIFPSREIISSDS